MSNIAPDRAKKIIDGIKGFRSSKEIYDVDMYYLRLHRFDIVKEIVLDSKKERRFYLSSDNRFFFSPTLVDPIFKINNCSEVKRVSILTEDRGDDAMIGALFLGAAGATVGSNRRYGIVEIRIELNGDQDPVQYFKILQTEVSKKIPLYKDAVKCAELICHILEERIPENHESIIDSNINTDRDFISQLEKLATLKEKGLLTDEEWLQAKRKLLS